jgi:photosystem II stability/assembly factor-like uncharacterized protein
MDLNPTLFPLSTPRVFFVLLLVIGCLMLPWAFEPQPSEAKSGVQLKPATKDLSGLQLSFVPNRGQHPAEISFVSQAVGQDIFFSRDEVIFSLKKSDPQKSDTDARETGPRRRGKRVENYKEHLVRLKLQGSSNRSTVEPEGEAVGKFNLLKGNDPDRWIRNLPTFERLRYGNVYDGVDLIFYGNQGKLQYDFVVAPRADPRKIKFRLAGSSNLLIEPDGDLKVETPAGDIELSRPFAYQIDKEGRKQEVPAEFRISGDGMIDFRLGDYDISRVLVIDPILTYSTFLGGSHEDIAYSVKVDAESNVYIAGTTRSVDFPVSASGKRPTEGNSDAFVTKIDPTGSHIIYSTVIGSNDRDEGYGLAIDGAGSAYLVGEARGVNFPQQNSLSYNSGFRKATFNVDDWQGVSGVNAGVEAVAVSGSNSMVAYAAGNGGVHKTIDGGATWRSVNRRLPSNVPLMKGVGVGGTDGNIALAGSGSTVYKTTDGGETWARLSFNFGSDSLRGIAIDKFDPSIAFVWKRQAFYRSTNGGATWNALLYPSGAETVVSHPTLPGVIYAGTTGGLLKSTDYGATWNAILGASAYSISFDHANPSIMYAGGFGVVYKSGPSDTEWAQISPTLRSTPIWAVASDPANPSHVYAAVNFEGIKRTTDGGATWNSFNGGLASGTTVRALARVGGGNTLFAGLAWNAPVGGFVLKLNGEGDDLVYSTIFSEVNVAVAVDAQGRAHVGGFTGWSEMPLVNHLRTHSGRDDGVVAIFSPDGGTLEFTTYIGGSEDDVLNGIALDPAGNIYATGETWSGDFPLVSPFQAVKKGQNDAWVTKISPKGAGFIY